VLLSSYGNGDQLPFISFTQQVSVSPIRKSCSDFVTGRDLSSTAFTSVKTAAFAPIPSSRTKMTVRQEMGRGASAAKKTQF
jgi:hypothetical protein